MAALKEFGPCPEHRTSFAPVTAVLHLKEQQWAHPVSYTHLDVYKRQDRDFQRKRREFQEDLSARKNEELQQVLERANKVVKQVAEAEKYDLVLQEVVYINPKHDMTEKVLKALNATK